MIGALLIKLPIYPVHLWLPKAHVEAPLAGSIALAGILLKLGVFGVVILGQLVAFPVGAASFILGLSLWGRVVTSVICVRQTDIKSLIAYSSIGHMGLALGGLLRGSELGIKGAIVVAVAHGLRSPAILSFASIVYDVTFSRSIFLCKGAGVDELGKSFGEVALVQSTGEVIITNIIKIIISTRQVATMESRGNTLPARDKPERSVRLMQEQGMLRKY